MTVSPKKQLNCHGAIRNVDLMGPRNHVIDGVQIFPCLGAMLSVMTSGFSCMPLNTLPSGPDVGISPHAVDHCFDWPAVESA